MVMRDETPSSVRGRTLLKAVVVVPHVGCICYVRLTRFINVGTHVSIFVCLLLLKIIQDDVFLFAVFIYPWS